MNIELFEKELKTAKANKENGYSPSFLEVVGKSSDEELISKYLSYLFDNNINLLNEFIRYAYGDSFAELKEINSINNEFATNSKSRIDIFIQATDIKNCKCIIVIENKVYTAEHDKQCTSYFNYCEQYYPKHKRYYFFLYPDFNLKINQISTNEFHKITYTNLLKILDGLDDNSKFEEDFINLINNQLRSNSMSELRKIFIENYEMIANELKSLNKELETLMNNFASFYVGQNNDVFEPCEKMESARTLRFYEKNGWWHPSEDKDEQYYFYIELKREGNLKFYCQQTIKMYSRNEDCKIRRFVKERCFNRYKMEIAFKDYAVLQRVGFTIEENKLSNDWERELFNWAIETLNQLKKEQEKLFEEFINFN